MSFQIKTMSGPDSHDETLTLLADKDQNTMEEKQFVQGRFRGFIFEELKSYSERLEMSFKKLTLRNLHKSQN